MFSKHLALKPNSQRLFAILCTMCILFTNFFLQRIVFVLRSSNHKLQSFNEIINDKIQPSLIYSTLFMHLLNQDYFTLISGLALGKLSIIINQLSTNSSNLTTDFTDQYRKTYTTAECTHTYIFIYIRKSHFAQR